MIYDNNFRLKVTEHFIKTDDAKGTSKKFNVPLSTVYRWHAKYKIGNNEGLKKKSTAPLNSPNKTCDEIERLVVDVWFEIKSQRNFSNMKEELGKKGVKLSPLTIKAILERKNYTN